MDDKKIDADVKLASFILALEELCLSPDMAGVKYLAHIPVPFTPTPENPNGGCKTKTMILHPDNMEGIFEAITAHSKKLLPSATEAVKFWQLHDDIVTITKENRELKSENSLLQAIVDKHDKDMRMLFDLPCYNEHCRCSTGQINHDYCSLHKVIRKNIKAAEAARKGETK